MSYAAIIAKEFNVKEEYVANIIALLDEGNTIPFIARYRKEMHGTMDDQTIRQISQEISPGASCRPDCQHRSSTVNASDRIPAKHGDRPAVDC